MKALDANSLELFRRYARDASNWNGTPLVGGNVRLLGDKEDRGLLTHLKRAGWITTAREEGCTWLFFTEAGKREAAERYGITIN